MGRPRGQTTLGASFLLIGTVITAPIRRHVDRPLGTRQAALISIFGIILGYVALSRQNGTIALFYATWFLMSFRAAALSGANMGRCFSPTTTMLST